MSDQKTTATRLRELAAQIGGWQAALITAGADDLDALETRLAALTSLALGAGKLTRQDLLQRLISCPEHGGAWSYKCDACRRHVRELEEFDAAAHAETASKSTGGSNGT